MDNLLLFIKLLSLKNSRFEKKMHFWDEILWGRFWSCLKHSQCVTSSVTSRSNFWPVTNHSLWFVTGQKFQEICVHKEEGERSSSYTRGCMWRVYRWKSYNFHFHEKAMSHDLLVQMAYSYGVTIQMKPLPSAILSHGAIYYVCSSNFGVCSWNPMEWSFKLNLFSSSFTWYYLFIM